MRLSSSTLSNLPLEIERFGYDREAQSSGIVHFGIGAFHRAHQAWYTDLAMDAGAQGWSICGVSLRSRSVADQLVPQDGLYTVTQRFGESAKTRLIGAVREVLFAPECRESVIERIAAPECHVVSFTVTEKGYARAGTGELDLDEAQHSFYPYLGEAIVRRMKRKLPGITLLPCDNLTDNGKVLRGLVTEWLEAYAPEASNWFAQECTVPSTMIDRIVPRSEPVDIAALEQQIGMTDKAAVFTEQFSQWVIEDCFAGPRPPWEQHGAQLVSEVAPYETAKLRLLNGAHSLLAYCGLRKGYKFVHEAVANVELFLLAEQLMREEATQTITAAADQDLGVYADSLMVRFADPALRHKLVQIAMDGSQKIPQRWLDTALWHARAGSSTPAILQGMEAWFWHLADEKFVDDPLKSELMITLSRSGPKGLLDFCLIGDDNKPPVWHGYRELHEAWHG